MESNRKKQKSSFEFISDEMLASIINVVGIGDGREWAIDKNVLYSVPRSIKPLVDRMRSQSSISRYKNIFYRFANHPRYPKSHSKLVDYYHFYRYICVNSKGKDGGDELQVIIHFIVAKNGMIDKKSNKRLSPASTISKWNRRLKKEEYTEIDKEMLGDARERKNLIVVGEDGSLNVIYFDYFARKPLNTFKVNGATSYKNNNSTAEEDKRKQKRAVVKYSSSSYYSTKVVRFERLLTLRPLTYASKEALEAQEAGGTKRVVVGDYGQNGPKK